MAIDHKKFKVSYDKLLNQPQIIIPSMKYNIMNNDII